MTWIILQGPNGQRKVQEGEPYRLEPGEMVVGSDKSGAGSADWALLNKQALESGSSLGDFVAALAKPAAILLGKTNCKSCDVRKLIIDLRKKLGFNGVWMFMKMSLTESPETVAQKIREALDAHP